MTKPSFTPGPWIEAEKHYSGVTPIKSTPMPYKSQQRQFCIASVANHKSTGNNGHKNARLIAAAPELFDALKEALFFMDTAYHLNPKKEFLPYIEMARKAIAKAI